MLTIPLKGIHVLVIPLSFHKEVEVAPPLGPQSPCHLAPLPPSDSFEIVSRIRVPQCFLVDFSSPSLPWPWTWAWGHGKDIKAGRTSALYNTDITSSVVVPCLGQSRRWRLNAAALHLLLWSLCAWGRGKWGYLLRVRGWVGKERERKGGTENSGKIWIACVGDGAGQNALSRDWQWLRESAFPILWIWGVEASWLLFGVWNTLVNSCAFRPARALDFST